MSIISWLPSYLSEEPSLLFIMAVPLSIVGFICASITKNRLLQILNIIMLFSFPITYYTLVFIGGP